MKVCCEKNANPGVPLATSVVMSLMIGLLNEGSILYTDNFYTSVHLAHKLLEQSTHLDSTLRPNRKLNPQYVVQAKPKKGNTKQRKEPRCSKEAEVQTRKGTKKKPAMIIDYNQSTSFIDLSDQMKLYSHCLKQGVKWYRNLAIELLTGSALVNAHVIYQYINNKISITEFKEEVTLRLLHTDDANEPETPLT
ncbi:uncharacterized protein LOC126152201 [Schistocerca cancellata]|uniref:uncharacterized protein LOC126152201 n=1 Tax=Schistocerca cancellata TaxID=274614 RepID=UPI0021192855|nr:uncharacterized protein LOC126152201 [Schistocerca cancellata]